MLHRVFPNVDLTSISETDKASIGHFLLNTIPEEELLSLSALHSKSLNYEGELSHFLARRLSEGILMEEANENNSKAIDFIASL